MEIELSQHIESAIKEIMTPVAELELLKRKEYLTEQDVAKLFSLSVRTLQTQRCRGVGPAYIKDGSKVLYSAKVIKAYLDAREVKTIG